MPKLDLPISAVLATPFGAMGLREADGLLHEIVFLPPGTPLQAPASPAGQAFAADLARYLADPDAAFALPPPTGTPFQRRVWQAIAAIPRGEVRSYGALARTLGSAPRAVGQACGANPYPLAIPCHRVVSATGLGGFAGATGGYLLASKRWLLHHEGVL
ncbi:MAG: methylated-DNA--[protein]-cysteine S-methyltransferase [Rhodocyclaceae bacterium]|jgi:methylated-DNA-[protein]-cysteine S-methyltransferase|nr:methylated-DNA--[protein]-cysteine S-methyltransferase [Rhodocyclaceae bacterium]